MKNTRTWECYPNKPILGTAYPESVEDKICGWGWKAVELQTTPPVMWCFCKNCRIVHLKCPKLNNRITFLHCPYSYKAVFVLFEDLLHHDLILECREYGPLNDDTTWLYLSIPWSGSKERRKYFKYDKISVDVNLPGVSSLLPGSWVRDSLLVLPCYFTNNPSIDLCCIELPLLDKVLTERL
jgi:hypothetical protein